MTGSRVGGNGIGAGRTNAWVRWTVGAWLIVAAAFWAAAAYLSDATFQDAVRAGLCTVAAFVAAWGLAALARRGAAGVSLSVLIGVVIVFGGVAVNYLLLEFGPVRLPAWPWSACPVAFAWSAAAHRQSLWTPTPLWAWLIWPAAGVVWLVLCVAWPPRKGNT